VKGSFVRVVGLFVVVMLMASLFLTGCGTKEDKPSGTTQSGTQSTTTASTTEETKAEKVKITFWHNYGADKETPYFADNIIPKFKEKYPNIDVEVVPQGDNQYSNLITTALGTNSAPDCARLDSTDVATFANQDGLLALDDMEGFGALKDSVYEGAMSGNLFKGKYYGFPIDTNCKAAVVSMPMLEKLGFKEPPRTMEEFIEVSKKNSPGKPTISVSSTGDWDFLPYFWLFGGVLSDEGFTKTTGYLDGKESIDAITKLLQLYKDKVLAIKELDGTKDAWDGIKDGSYAMMFEGPWFYTFNGNWKDLKTTPAPIPTYNGKTASIIGGQSAVVFKSSKHPKEAFEFVKFLLSEEVQTLEGLNMGQIPVLKSAAQNSDIKTNEVWGVYFQQLNSAKARIPSPYKQVIQDTIKDKFSQIFTEKETPEQALKEAAAIIDAELAK
jgi:ABC-type sugar transport system, periplasmic component